MKKMKIYLLSLIAAVGCFACSDDEGFGRLEYQGAPSYTLEVHRDTANSCKISLPITSEKGLAKVTLVDATGKTLDEKTSFADQKSYTYEYNLDLTEYTQNSAIMLTLNITDVDGQAIKQSITVNVKKFSELDIRFAFEGKLASLFEDCNLKFSIKRGMIPLQEVKVYVGTELSSEYDLSLDPTQSQYDLNLPVNGLKIGNNDVKVVVIDAKDQEFERVIAVERVAARGLLDVNRVNINGGNPLVKVNMESGTPLPDKEHLYNLFLGASAEGSKYINFDYNGDRVSVMRYTLIAMNEDTWEEMTINLESYKYEYNAEGELVKVTKATETSAAVDYVTDIVYELGNIKSYKIEGKTVMANYLEKDGEIIRVDYLDKDMSGWTYGLKTRNNNNPLYFAALPAVVPGQIGGFELNILYNRYFFDTLNNGNAVVYNYNIGELEDGGYAYNQTISWEEGGVTKTMKYQYSKPN